MFTGASVSPNPLPAKKVTKSKEERIAEKKAKRRAEELAQKAAQEEEANTLTAQELQQIQKDSDLEVAKQLFGAGGGRLGPSC